MRRAAEHMADRLRTRILTSSLPPGTLLASESDLIAEAGLSRASVREGLRLLEAEGLIELKRGPNGGVFTRRPDFRAVSRSLALQLTLESVALDEFFAVRMLIEPTAARLAAVNGTDEQRAEISRYANTESSVETSARVGFHVLIGEAANNTVIRILLSVIGDVVRWHSRAERLSEADTKHSIAAHREIAAAIEARDGSRAEHLMLRHLEAFRSLMADAGRLDEPIMRPAHWEQTDGPAS